MKKIMLVIMLLLTVCASALAAGVDDVLKDCRLDRNRWKVVEWFQKEKYVRLYDSSSVSVAGPGRFEAVIYDYYYDGDCGRDSCPQRGNKHFHTEKWTFNTAKSAGILHSFATKDMDENIVTSYNYPSNNLIEAPFKRKSAEDRTMQKIREQVKGNKDFAAETPMTKTSKASDNYGGFAPLPQPIGSMDGEWKYLGRYVGPNNLTYLENILKMTPFTGTTARDGVLDVYFYHTHDMCRAYEAGFTYGCILKFIPLDMNGNRLQRRGFYTELVDVSGGTKGIFVGSVTKVRKYDTETHELVETLQKNSSYDSILNPLTSYGYRGAEFMGTDHPFWTARRYSNCPGFRN